MTGIGHKSVRKALYSRNPNMIAGLCWKAKLPMTFARLVQEIVGRIHPDDCIDPTDDGDYPMSEGTLEWNFALCSDEDDSVSEAANARPQKVAAV